MNTLEKILSLIKKNGLTEFEFTEKLGVNKTTISEWKKGKTKSYNKYIDKIAELLKVTPEYLKVENEYPVIQSDLTITERLLEALKNKNITQKELCEHINVPQSTFSNWIKFNRTIPSESLIPICEFIQIDIKWLLTGDKRENMNNENSNKTYNNIKTDENVILKIYNSLNEEEKQEFLEFAYRKKFYNESKNKKNEL